ncbi:MAG: hypothetical protein LH645_08605 [Actinomycetia bacterium]|nr:hypothetical protein [Actinomycetes bacterium]
MWGRGMVDGHTPLFTSWPTVFVVIVVAAVAGTRAWAVRSERQKLSAAPEPVAAFAD